MQAQLASYPEQPLSSLSNTYVKDYSDNAYDIPDSNEFTVRGESNLLKGAAAVAAVATMAVMPTLVAPAIKHVTDTMIQGVSIQSIFDRGDLVQQAEETKIEAVINLFNVIDTNAVRDYLQVNSELTLFLESVASKIKDYQLIESTTLEFYKDHEEGWEKLFVIVTTSTDDMDVVASIEDEIFDTVFEPSHELTLGRVVLSVG